MPTHAWHRRARSTPVRVGGAATWPATAASRRASRSRRSARRGAPWATACSRSTTRPPSARAAVRGARCSSRARTRDRTRASIRRSAPTARRTSCLGSTPSRRCVRSGRTRTCAWLRRTRPTWWRTWVPSRTRCPPSLPRRWRSCRARCRSRRARTARCLRTSPARRGANSSPTAWRTSWRSAPRSSAGSSRCRWNRSRPRCGDWSSAATAVRSRRSSSGVASPRAWRPPRAMRRRARAWGAWCGARRSRWRPRARADVAARGSSARSCANRSMPCPGSTPRATGARHCATS